MATLSDWVAGARPRTLPAAFAPVAVGTGSAAAIGAADLGLAVLALVVAVLLQVGVNYANDYSDGVRGTDAADMRVGPVRLVGQRLAAPGDVKAVAMLCFAAAAVAGLALVALAEAWLLLLIGAVAIWAAWSYTGGERPYGYRGFGEVMVFVFFGLVAVLGTTWTQARELDLASWAGAIGVGALSCAILVVNNLRDIEGDGDHGKHTLAVRLGPARTRTLYAALLAAPFLLALVAAVVHPWALVALPALAVGWRPWQLVRSGASGPALVPVLGQTSLLLLAYALLLTFGLALSAG